MKKRSIVLGLISGLLALMLTACSSNESNIIKNIDAESNQVITLLAANEGHTNPMEYLDENGNLTGYEVDVLKAIDDVLPQYKIEFEITEFASIFTGLNTGKYQIGFNSLSKTPVREEKYIFPKHYVKYENIGLYLTPGLTEEHPINTISDLGGLRTVSNAKGDTFQQFLENFNETYPDNPIKIQYSDQDWSTTHLQVYNGRVDFITGSESSLSRYKDEYGYTFEFVELPAEEAEKISDPKTWFIFPKTEEGQNIADAVDSALEQLNENGKLKEISEQYFGKDLTGTSEADW